MTLRGDIERIKSMKATMENLNQRGTSKGKRVEPFITGKSFKLGPCGRRGKPTSGGIKKCVDRFPHTVAVVEKTRKGNL